MLRLINVNKTPISIRRDAVPWGRVKVICAKDMRDVAKGATSYLLGARSFYVAVVKSAEKCIMQRVCELRCATATILSSAKQASLNFSATVSDIYRLSIRLIALFSSSAADDELRDKI